jgi:capsular exopolysaccharide synthesis family protein
MDFNTYLQIIKRRKWILILPISVCLLLMALWKIVLPTSTDVSATLRVVPYSSGDPTYTQLIYADRIMNTFVQIATSEPVMDEVRDKLKLSPDHPEDLEVRPIPETELLQITVTDPDPNLARDVASAISTILLNERSIRDVRIYLVDPPQVDPGPSLFSYLMDFILAFILGSVGGIGLVFIAENLDTRIYTVRQISSITDIPIIGEIPIDEKGSSGSFNNDKFPFNEYYRRLRTSLITTAQKDSIKTVLITSAEPEEGKSTITANLASSVAETGRNILVIDADLYLAKMHDLFDLRNDIGLSQVLDKNASLDESIQLSQRNNIKVLTGGPKIANHSELLGSEKMDALLEQVKQDFDFVFLDTPPFSAIVDTAYLIPKVDFVLIVSRLGQSREPTLSFTLQQIKNLGANHVGLIVNNVEARIPSRYIKYYRQAIAELKEEKEISGIFTEENKLQSSVERFSGKLKSEVDKVLDHHVPYELPMKTDEDIHQD